MTLRPKLAPEQQMTIEEFLAFTDTRPDEERWELIEGVPVLNPSPIDYHQIVVTNISGFLWRFKMERDPNWYPLVGTGTRVPASAHSLPQPDVMVKNSAMDELRGFDRELKAAVDEVMKMMKEGKWQYTTSDGLGSR